MKNIVEIIEREVIGRCKNYQEKTGEDEWSHIELVAYYALELAERYGADKEITALGALLHDISGPSEYGAREEHHIRGAEIAGQLLSGLDYPQDKIERVKNCVLNHRGSVPKDKNTLEEECVADADALAHFDRYPGLFLPEGIEGKFERDYNKLSEKTRGLIKDRYDIMMSILFSGKSFLK